MFTGRATEKVDGEEMLSTVAAMATIQYPAVETIKAFGGSTRTAQALGLNKQNIHKWTKSKTGLIPRWWSAPIEVAAKAHGVKLPRPTRMK